MATGIFRRAPFTRAPRKHWGPQFSGGAPVVNDPPVKRHRARWRLFRRRAAWRPQHRLLPPQLAVPPIAPVVKRKVTPVWARWPKKRMLPLLLRPRFHPAAFSVPGSLALAARARTSAALRATPSGTAPLIARAASMSTGRALVAGAAALAARSVAGVRGRAVLSTGLAFLSAAVSFATRATAALAGSISLRATITISTSLRAGMATGTGTGAVLAVADTGVPHFYDLGDVVRVAAIIVDFTGAAVDPNSITVKVLNVAAGTQSFPNVVRDSAGHYHADIAIPVAATASGAWYYRFEASNPNAAADGDFIVRPSKFYP